MPGAATATPGGDKDRVDADAITLRVNAGGGAYTDGAGQVWAADNAFFGGSTASTGSAIANTADDPLYQSERYGDFRYQFPTGPGSYTVTLKFAEIYHSAAGQRVFDVLLEGQLVLDNFDIVQAAGGPNRAVDRTFTATVTGNNLDIEFRTVVDNAKVSAIQVLSTSPGATPTPTRTPTSPPGTNTFRVHAGGGAYTDGAGQVWAADNRFSGGSTASTGSAIAGTNDDPLYQSERYGDFSYNFPVSNGNYTVTLKFAEIYWSGPGERVFNVLIEGQSVLSNFDIIVAAGAANTAVDRSFTRSVSDGTLNIEFRTVVDNAKVSAIEVLPASPGGTPTLSPTPTRTPTRTPTSPPLTNTYRVNAGGGAYTGGAGQVWAADNRFSGGNTSGTGAAIANTTDDPLYQSERYGDFSYNFPVSNGSYTVTLKFAEIYWGGPGQRVFDVLIEGALVLDNFDVFAAAGAANSAVDRSFTTGVSDGTLNIEFRTEVDNAKISAIEILPATSGGAPPAMPVFLNPGTDGQLVNPFDPHFETSAFSDPDPGQTHRCTDWEVRLAGSFELVWVSSCNTAVLAHAHKGDGTMVGSHAGWEEFWYETDYIVRARYRSSGGDAATEWSPWAQRAFRTPQTPPEGDPTTPWTVRQPGYVVEEVVGGLELPVNIAFHPNPGPGPNDPLFYVTELYGNIKVVTRNGTVSDYIRGVLNYRPSGIFPGSGEQGLTGLLVDPVSKDLFASMLYDAGGEQRYPKVVRFRSNATGTVAASFTTILDMPGEQQGPSHQISHLSIGPDGKLYVHMGDGFEPATAQNMNSFRGKILRVNLDGSAPTDNPFYNASDGITARDYIFASGFRNPFGGAWRSADNTHYSVENGPSVDRFAKIVRGRNYLWDGTDASMRNFALYNWIPAVAPVNLIFLQASNFGTAGFPSSKLGHAYVSESGPTYATGPQTLGKRISEFVLDGSGNVVSGPTTLVEYTGAGKATVVGLAAGPDGLYFTELYKDLDYTGPTDPGARVMRVRYVGTGAATSSSTTAGGSSEDADLAALAIPAVPAVPPEPREGSEVSEYFTVAAMPAEQLSGAVALTVNELPALYRRSATKGGVPVAS